MSKKTLLAILGIALVLGIGLTYRLMMMGTETNSSGTASIGGPFELVNQDGKTVTQDDFKGKYMLAYFGYTFCPDVCPTELQIIGTALDMMPDDVANEVTPVFFTVDPERDTVRSCCRICPLFP